MDSLQAHPYLVFLHLGGDRLDEARQSGSALRLALRLAATAFSAQTGCVVARSATRGDLVLRAALPKDVAFDAEEYRAFLGKRRPPMPVAELVAPLPRNHRDWGALVLRRTESFSRAERQDFLKVARHVSRALERLDRARLAMVRERIDRKVLEQVRPRDLFYQVLHGLHSLTRYDHSAAVAVVRGEGELAVVAEQVAWRKGGSSVVGTKRPLSAAVVQVLQSAEVLGFDRVDGQWLAWGQGPGERLPEPVAELLAVLDYNRATGAVEERCECSILCVPLIGRGGVLGFLKVACRRPGFLGHWEADLVRRFMPQVAVALHNLERTSFLQSGVEAAERKTVLAELARGVAHDVNNALGAALPLVQQLRADAAEESLDARTLSMDLESLEGSLLVCRRIFGGMLAFARSAVHGGTDGNVRRALESAVAVLGESCRRRAIELRLSLPDRLPPVRCPQSDLEQLLLNLATNARDAMPDGGTLTLDVARGSGYLDLTVTDTGVGIDPAVAGRIEEPFFSTKSGGSGLGLGICRAIVTRTGGHLRLESIPGEGTRAQLRLPCEVREETP